MNYKEYEIEFRKKATNAGYSEDITQKCLIYAEPLIKQNLPVIYNTANLAALVGYRKEFLKKTALYSKFFYRHFEIVKKNGNKRQISEPLPNLKDVQRWILENILYEIHVSRFAKAYIPKKTILENVKYHKNQKKVLSLDIKDFFPSIKQEYIDTFFRELGYNKYVANLLSKLCTLNGCLPQGAPTSPYLSNLILLKFDESIEKYCKERKIKYTRYADDLTFSGDFDEKHLTSFVIDKISEEKLQINTEKTKLMLKTDRQVITGIIVNTEILQVPKEKRLELRQVMYYINKFGLEDHLKKINCKKNNYLWHLLGIATYILFINPKDEEVIEYRKKISAMLPSRNTKSVSEK